MRDEDEWRREIDALLDRMNGPRRRVGERVVRHFDEHREEVSHALAAAESEAEARRILSAWVAPILDELQLLETYERTTGGAREVDPEG